MNINKKTILTTALVAIGSVVVINSIRKGKKNESKKVTDDDGDENLNAEGYQVPMLDITYDQTISNQINDIVMTTAAAAPRNRVDEAKRIFLRSAAYKNLYYVGDSNNASASLPYYKAVKVKGKSNAYKLTYSDLKNYTFAVKTPKFTPTNILGFLKLIGVDMNNGLILAQYKNRAAFYTLLDPNDLHASPIAVASSNTPKNRTSDLAAQDVSSSNIKVFTAQNNTKLRTSAKINDGWWNNVAKVLPQRNSFIGFLVGTVQPADQTNKLNPNTGELYRWHKVRDGKSIYYVREDVVRIKYPASE